MGIHAKNMVTSPRSLRAHLCSLSHYSETHVGIEYSPPCPLSTIWNLRHRLHRRTKPWQVSHTLSTTWSPREKLVYGLSPRVCTRFRSHAQFERGRCEAVRPYTPSFALPGLTRLPSFAYTPLESGARYALNPLTSSFTVLSFSRREFEDQT